MKAALYVRISLDQAGKSLGVTRQRQDCCALAGSLGWEVVDVYADNDVSATSGKARPGYRKMLADIEDGRVDAIIAWAPDRIYRRLKDLEDLIPILETHGVAVRTVKAGDLDLSSAYGRMVARILGAVATGEGEIKAERWKRSWRQGRELGVVPRTGSRMFGYTRDGNLIPDEAKIAQQMAHDIIAGVPILTVARQLETAGVTTTRGGVWRPGTVRQYLANPRIAGHSTLGGEILADGQWEPILDRDTWETVRALLNSRARGPRPRASLLTGLIYCGACDHRLITSGQRGKRTYRCPHRPGMPGCGRLSGNAEPIEEIVEEYARAKLNDPLTHDALDRLASSGAPDILAEIGDIEGRIQELEAQLDEPGVPVSTILRAIDRSRVRLEDCQRRLSASPPVALPTSGGDWPTDLERRRRLVDLVVGRVTLGPATRNVRYFDPERITIIPR